MSLLMQKEKNRSCAACGKTGDVLLATFKASGARVRCCGECWEKVQGLRFKIAAYKLDSVETNE
jgi:hypothetical protein